MLLQHITNQFKKDVKLCEKRGYTIQSLKDVMVELVSEIPLAEKYKDHILRGNYEGYRECHIEPDWLLIYKIVDRDIYFTRTGTHSDLFG